VRGNVPQDNLLAHRSLGSGNAKGLHAPERPFYPLRDALQWEWTDIQPLLRLPFSDTQAIVAPRSDRPSCCRGPAINAVALHSMLGISKPTLYAYVRSAETKSAAA